MSKSEYFPHCFDREPDLEFIHKGVTFHLHSELVARESSWFAHQIRSGNKSIIHAGDLRTKLGLVKRGTLSFIFYWMYCPLFASAMPFENKRGEPIFDIHDNPHPNQQWLPVAEGWDLRVVGEKTPVVVNMEAMMVMTMWGCDRLLRRCHDMLAFAISAPVAWPDHYWCCWLWYVQDGAIPVLETLIACELIHSNWQWSKECKYCKNLSPTSHELLQAKTGRLRR